MAIELSDVRASFVWVETVLDPFKEGAHLALLGQPYSFGPCFEKAREAPVVVDSTEGISLSLSAPWPKPTGQRFWRSYVGGEALQGLKGVLAWKSLTPLKSKVPFQISNSLAGVTLGFDAYFYPCGLALLATARFAQKSSLVQTIAEASKLRRDAVVTVDWPGGKGETGTLDAIADRILDRLRNFGWGDGSSGRRTALDPFSVFTIVRGTGDAADFAVAADSEAHRALEAVANWSVSWAKDPLPALDKARLSSHNPPIADGKLVYGGKRGRALWFPAVFAGPAAVATLACYHRNLIQASLQTEVLCGFVSEMAKKIGNKEKLTMAMRECAQNATGILGRMYGGKNSVYRSWSVRVQIDQSGMAPDINAVRAYFGMGPLG